MSKLNLFKSYWGMTKPGIMMMVLVTTALGFYFADHGIQNPILLCWTLLASALTCGGASVINQYLERDVDALMHRTQNRPIPMGVISPAEAMGFGLTLILIGLVVFCLEVNLLTAFLSLLTCFLYIVVYGYLIHFLFYINFIFILTLKSQSYIKINLFYK